MCNMTRKHPSFTIFEIMIFLQPYYTEKNIVIIMEKFRTKFSWKKNFFMLLLNHAVQCTHQFPMFLKRQTEGDTRNIS